MIKNENTRGGALAEESGALAGERRPSGWEYRQAIL